MITREDIITELTNKGYKAEKHTSIKNGVEFNGVCFMHESGICPVVYTDSIIEESGTLLEAVENVLGIYKNNKTVKWNMDNLLSPDFIMRNLYIGVQKEGMEDIAKSGTDFEGIEKYLYVKMDVNASFKVTYAMLDALKVSKDGAWEAAESNTFAGTRIVPMAEMLSEMTGQEIQEADGIPGLYVVTNAMGFRGASAILDKASLEKLACRLNVHRLIVLPSSVHEMLVLPDNGEGHMEELHAMVQEVNQAQVAPEERLTDRAYVMEA